MGLRVPAVEEEKQRDAEKSASIRALAME